MTEPNENPIPPPLAQHAAPAPQVTSAAAIASLVLALVGLCCLPIVGGIAALLLGIVAIFDIRGSDGRKRGTGLAALGASIGGLTAIAWVAVLVALISATPSSHSPPAPTAWALPPTATAPAPYAVPAPRSTALVPSMSRDMSTVETSVGKLVVVDIGADVKSLENELRAQRAKASAAGESLVLQTTGSGCRPCLGVAASLADPKMQTALAGVRLVRVDVNDFDDELEELGIPHEVIPGLFLLDSSLHPADGIHGGEWDDDTATNIAPVVGAFVKGTFTTRREQWTKRRKPRPIGTAL